MSEIVRVEHGSIGGELVQTVSARELHLFLGVGKDFSTWIKDRIEQFGFVEDADFVVFPEIGEKGGRPQISYHLTLDMAKELSMVERNERGKQARQYFIECEKRLKAETPEMQMARGLLAAQRLIENQTRLIEDMKPKAEFFDAVTESKDAVDVGSVAKVLNMGIGRTRLFEFLRDCGILMQNNQPYQKYVDAGYFRVIEQKWNKPDGSTHISLKTVVYQKGVDYIRRKFSETEKKAA